jgi:hypothetical protein
MYPMPNLSQFVLPMIVAPGWCKTVASSLHAMRLYHRTLRRDERALPRSMAEEHVVGRVYDGQASRVPAGPENPENFRLLMSTDYRYKAAG